VEDASVVIYLWSLHTLQSVDVDLRPELYALIGAYLWATEGLKDYDASSEIVVPVNAKGAVLV